MIGRLAAGASVGLLMAYVGAQLDWNGVAALAAALFLLGYLARSS